MMLSHLHQNLSPGHFETIRVLKKLNAASQELAELKGVVAATSYLNQLTEGCFLHKRKMGRANYYINLPLYRILANLSEPAVTEGENA
jgi:hypothetical protein